MRSLPKSAYCTCRVSDAAPLMSGRTRESRPVSAASSLADRYLAYAARASASVSVGKALLDVPPDEEDATFALALLAGLDVQPWTLKAAAAATSARPDATRRGVLVVPLSLFTDGEDTGRPSLRTGKALADVRCWDEHAPRLA